MEISSIVSAIILQVYILQGKLNGNIDARDKLLYEFVVWFEFVLCARNFLSCYRFIDKLKPLETEGWRKIVCGCDLCSN